MGKRIERANSEILRCLSDIVHNKMNDPRIDEFVIVSEVKITPDFKYCKVKISTMNDDFEKAPEIISVLQKSEGYIKRELAQMVNMPSVPKITFEFDKSTLNVIRVEELLRGLNIPPEEE